MFTSKKITIFSLLIFCLFFLSAAFAGSQLNTISNETGKDLAPAICTDDSETEVYEETEEGDYDESYDESQPEDMQGDPDMETE
ncbi:MAG: hypothetical protein JW864_02565 [Spirochaetes bacterium]|nr:hypothetical protein [Spirochaetota bacterium]